jgi:capsular exopolysaccharide synthesis family protein
MTTLPQNAPVRVNRPPVGMPSIPAGGAAAAGGMNLSDVIRVLRSNWLMLALLFVFSAIAGFGLNWYLLKNFPSYKAEGYCEISLPVSATLFGRDSATMNDQSMAIEQRTQVQAMRSEALYSRVLQNPNSKIRETTWFKSFAGNPSLARQDLIKNFSAAAITDTRLIAVSMQYSVPEDCALIVEEVVSQHLRDQGQIALNRQFDRTQTLQTMKLRLESDLRNAAQERREQQTRLNAGGIDAGNVIGISSKKAELEDTLKNYQDAKENLQKIKSALDSLNNAAANGQDPPMLVRAVENDPEYQKLVSSQRDAEFALKNYETKYGKEAPMMQELRGRKETLEQRAQELRKDLLNKMKVSQTEELTNQQKGAEGLVQQLNARLDALRAEMGELANAMALFQAAQARELNITAQLRDVNENLDRTTITNTSGNGATINWAIHPIKPEIPSFPKLSATMTMSIVVGLLIGLGIAFGIELLDQTIRSPRDVSAIGPIPVLGMISHEDDDPQSAGARLPLVIAEAPSSMTAEQLRQFRTRLQHAASLDTTRSLLVTSPNPGDGKTTVAANLAAGLALVGRRILLVDANFRRPELHRLFGVENNAGFAGALTAPDQLPSLVKATKIPNLTVLTAGTKPGNATEMLESALLHDFIDKVLEQYDHVVFDSGPILFASETVAMSPRVDGVITVVRARQSTRGVLARTKDILRQIKAESLGVVINGIRSYGGGYYSRNIKTYYEYASNGTNS